MELWKKQKDLINNALQRHVVKTKIRQKLWSSVAQYNLLNPELVKFVL